MKFQVGSVYVPVEALVDLDAPWVDARPGDRFDAVVTLYIETRGEHQEDAQSERITSVSARATRFRDVRKYAS
jgi:hypothetical protein